MTLIERLRELGFDNSLGDEAADEIERLRGGAWKMSDGPIFVTTELWVYRIRVGRDDLLAIERVGPSDMAKHRKCAHELESL